MLYRCVIVMVSVVLWATTCPGSPLQVLSSVEGVPPAENNLFFPTPTPDTIRYDDGTGVAYYNVQDWYFTVRFSPIIPCSLRGATVANYQTSATDSCSLFVWANSGGEPGALLHAPVLYLGTSLFFRQVDLDSALYFDTDFWIGYYAPGPPFCLMDANPSSPLRSFYSSTGTTWWEINAGDLLLRALIDYGGVLIHDVSVKSLRATGGFFLRSPAASTPSVTIENLGDTTEYNFPVECLIIDTSYTSSVVYADTKFVAQIDPQGLDTVVFETWNPIVDGEYIISATALLPGDMVTDNDVKYREIQVCSPPRAALTYDDDDFDGSFTGVPDNAWATEYVPPWYPCLVESVKIYFGTSGDPAIMWVMDDDGPWRLPGTVWYAETVSVSSGWRTFDTYLKAPVFDDGKFYIAYWYKTGAPSLGYDSDLPIASQTWRFTGSWTRDVSNDWLMRAYVSMVEKHDAAVIEILEPPDTVLTDSTYDVVAALANLGNLTDTIDAFCTIDGYADSLQFPDVGYGQTVQASFAQWIVPHTDTFAQVTMTVYVSTYNDRNPSNDTLQKTIVYGPPVGISESRPHRASTLPVLGQNSPNPFSSSTTIQVRLPEEDSNASLKIYDTSGRLIRSIDVDSASRSTCVRWDGKTDKGDDTRSGVYFYRLSSKDTSRSRKMILIR